MKLEYYVIKIETKIEIKIKMKSLLRIGINEIMRGRDRIYNRLHNRLHNENRLRNRQHNGEYNHFRPLKTEVGDLCVINGGPYDGFIHQGKIGDLKIYGKYSQILFIDETHYTKYEDVVDLTHTVVQNNQTLQYIFKETPKINENNCIHRFNQNTSFKQMISNSLHINDKSLPKSVYGFKYENPSNNTPQMHYTSLTYHNSIGHNIFNYYKQTKTKSGKFICTSGAFISSDDSDYISHYKPNEFEDDVYLNEFVDVFLENIRNRTVIDYDAELYWKTHFICNVAKISTRNQELIDIPDGITINESLDFLDELKAPS